MNTNPQIFHGEWWVPAVADHNTRMNVFDPKKMMGLEKKYTGTLTYYGDKNATLELYHVPSNFHSSHYHQNKVMWGIDANGHIFTLFNVLMKEQRIGDFTCTKFVVSLILMGEHVLSGDDACYCKCVVQFPYLRNWAFQNKIEGPDINIESFYTPTTLLEVQCEDGVCWRLRQYQPVERTIHDLIITHTTEFEIETSKALSVKSYLKQIEEFAQFLSIALYRDQNPTEMKLVNKENGRESILLFKKDASVDPDIFTLIKFDLLKDKLPLMLNQWHNNFDKMAPISSYLIDSLQKKSRFDVPDFLIIAQALDGYHKRFVNKKNGKDHQKYEDGIKILLKQFEDVDCIQKCNIDPIRLRDSRNFYSHLSPDEEKKSAVDSADLYWLTEKCKILLTCCILNMLGLTNKEINLCCESLSPIKQIIDSFPIEID